MSIRYRFCAVLLLILMGSLAAKLFWLHVYNKEFLQKEGNARMIRQKVGESERGVIVDRHGLPLGISAVVYDISINPHDVNLVNPNWKSVFNLLDLNAPLWTKKIRDHKGQFAYLKRQVSPDIVFKLKSMKLKGLYFSPKFARFYVDGNAFAHVIGFTGIDSAGQEGLELYYNDWLSGTNSVATHIKDLKGNVIGVIGRSTPAVPGKPVMLSIDKRIQYTTFQALKSAVMKHGASSGSAVILNANTGEVLAMANYPSFNPNNKSTLKSNVLRNRAISDSIEAGSTIKTFAMAKVLAHGDIPEDHIVSTYPGFYKIGRNTITDSKNHGVLTMSEVLSKSSNVGMSKLILTLPSQSFPAFLSTLGFGEITGIELPGEVPGIFATKARWRKFELATLSFGYGLAVTNLQLAQAYAVLANEGVKHTPTLLKRDQVPAGEVVLSPKVANTILKMLTTVTALGGTAVNARVPGYVVAGKTGTARKAIPGGYSKDKYVAVFAGIVPAGSVPAEQTRLVMVIMIDETHGLYYYGGAVAAPVFAKVMHQVLPLLGIAPTI